ncbi:MAG: TRAP transporter small permease [Thermodesulfobacteriota bacterium]
MKVKALVNLVTRLSQIMYWLAGLSLVSIVALTVADVILRLFKMPILGTYELVGFLGAWAIGFAIPQTSLDRGHVYMDFVFGYFNRPIKMILSTLTRLMGIFLFALMGYNLFLMGSDLWSHGEVSITLHVPQFPIAYGLAFACLVECLVLMLDLLTRSKTQS